MENEIILTVFTPAYNRAHTLHRCYESLCRQKCKQFKWLIIDDGSSDKTTEIANSIESEKIKVFTLDKNRGKGYALNYGLKIAMKNGMPVHFKL